MTTGCVARGDQVHAFVDAVKYADRDKLLRQTADFVILSEVKDLALGDRLWH